MTMSDGHLLTLHIMHALLVTVQCIVDAYFCTMSAQNSKEQLEGGNAINEHECAGLLAACRMHRNGLCMVSYHMQAVFFLRAK
jgi:hypothetical protein